MSDLILYTSDDGTTRVDLRVEGGTIWLTQAEIAELFQTTKPNISMTRGKLTRLHAASLTSCCDVNSACDSGSS